MPLYLAARVFEFVAPAKHNIIVIMISQLLKEGDGLIIFVSFSMKVVIKSFLLKYD